MTAGASQPNYVRYLLLTLLFSSVGLCTACQRHIGTPARAVAIDPCQLITRADAQRILGTSVKPAIRTDVILMATGHECHYVTSATAAYPDAAWGIEIIVYDNATVEKDNASMFKSAMDYFRRDMAALQSSGTKLVPIAHLGEEAYWQPGPDLLHVLDHGVYFVLDVDADFHIPPGDGSRNDQQFDSAKRAAEITLAQDTILPRLEQAQSVSPTTRSAASSSGHAS